MAEKIYVPKCYARGRETQYGEFIGVSFNVDELVKFAEAHKNDRGELKLTVCRRKQTSENGITHSVFLDDFKPDASKRTAPSPTASGTTAPADKSPTQDDVPF